MASPFGPVALPLTGCITLLVSAIMIVLAYVAPYWATYQNDHTGLWKRGACTPDHGCWFVDFEIFGTPAWVNAVRGLVSITVILLGLKLVCIPVYLYVSVGLYYRVAMIMSAISSLVAAILIFIAAVIYGIKATALKWTLAWCFPIVIVGAIFTVFAAIIFAVCIFTKKPNFKEYYMRKASKYRETSPYTGQPNPGFYTEHI